MALPSSFLSLTLADNTAKSNGTAETTNASVPIITMTPSNAADTITAIGNLKTALAAITLGTQIKTDVVYSRVEAANVPVDDVLAQRENKWLVRYHDATSGQKYVVSFGTADLSQLPATHTEFLDIVTDASVGKNFKVAFEAVVKSPADASHAVVVDSIQFVGRTR